MKKLRLVVVSQEKQLLDVNIDSASVPSTTGELTILPGHIPLFTPLQAGELRYTQDKEEHSMVVSKGFLDIGPDDTLTVMVDTAVSAREISVQKAQAAIEQAQATIMTSRDREELIRAEAELRLALLEIKVAEKTKRSNY
jgi:F-type H+-transporting ATPase subunit epsilon